MKSGVYKLINAINGRIYIGSSRNIEERIKKHIRLLKKNKHDNQYMQNDYNKTGGKFYSEIVELIDDEILRLEAETKLILHFYDNQINCYNINKTAFITGRVRTQEGLARMKTVASITAKKLWKSEEFVQKMKLLRSSKEWKAKNAKASQIANSKYYNTFLIHENGTEEFIENNLSDFCRKYNLFHSSICGLIHGKYKFVAGWRLKTTEIQEIKVKSPSGEVHVVGNNKTKFCLLNGISDTSHFSKLLKGKIKSCNGWLLIK